MKGRVVFLFLVYSYLLVTYVSITLLLLSHIEGRLRLTLENYIIFYAYSIDFPLILIVHSVFLSHLCTYLPIYLVSFQKVDGLGSSLQILYCTCTCSTCT
ncbi:hypothetical protein F4805DRAFT_411293 [Annulohypoxylon moriforme]|nr:hypothetical protein F4805DRAFT_411293 [Annulohypoxylon moriforme]